MKPNRTRLQYLVAAVASSSPDLIEQVRNLPNSPTGTVRLLDPATEILIDELAAEHVHIERLDPAYPGRA